MSYFDPYLDPMVDEAGYATIGAEPIPRGVNPNIVVPPVAQPTARQSLIRQLFSNLGGGTGRAGAPAAETETLTGLAKLRANPWARTVGVPIAAGIAAPIIGERIGGSTGEHVAGAIGGAGTGFGIGSALLGAKLGSKAGAYGALAGAILGGTGLGQKIPGVGPLLFGQAGGGEADEVTADDLEAYGATPAEVDHIMSLAGRIEKVEGKDVAQQYLATQQETYKAKLLNDTIANDPNTIKDRALIAQAISKAMIPYRDEASRNIELARQSAMKSGMPEVANQYFEMSKATANAYAQQAVLFAPMQALQQTLQDQLNAQAAAGSGSASSSGLFSQLGQYSALGNQAAALGG